MLKAISRYGARVISTTQQIARQLRLGRLARLCRAIDMSSLGLVALNQALLVHDLKELKDRGVLGCPSFADHVVNGSNRRGATAPEHRKNL